MSHVLGSFEPYNARFVDPRTVAETFVLRKKEFLQLCEQNNSLLVGPRGSGKTTLLKMLKVGAQIAWKNQRQANILRRFSFAPIYVGADRQLDLVVSSTKLDESTRLSTELIAKALLSFRVKFACLDTVREISDPTLKEIPSLAHQFVPFPKDKEELLCLTLSTVWDLGRDSLSLLEVSTRLQWQLAEINRFVDRIKYGSVVTANELIDYAQYLSHDPIYSCQSFIIAFNDVCGFTNKIWALCVDELEIMPEAIQQYLFSCLRSIDQRIVLKLATSPFSSINWDSFAVARPMPGHDFTPINLAFTKKSDSRRSEARRFSAALLDAMIAAEGQFHGSNRPHGRSVLGQSPIAEANNSADQRAAYKPPNGDHYLRFKRLQELDVAFNQFIRDRGVNLEQVHLETDDRRAGQVRKHIWHVAVRLEHGPTNVFTRRDKTTGERPPSRKKIPEIYLGFDSLMTMCEGNPRTTISLLRPFVRYFVGAGRPIPYEDQSMLVEEAIRKYMSLLSTIKLNDPSGERRNLSVVNLIKEVGEFFQSEINGAIFKSEPLLTFAVDRSISEEYVEAIGSAMNQGAFIMIDDESKYFDFGSIHGARLRLSYLLCPLYHLPLILGGTAQLSRIFKEKMSKQPKGRVLNQEDLFMRNNDE